jgi:prepilin-type N-terminal cleavage/methylation domain-containing protein
MLPTAISRLQRQIRTIASTQGRLVLPKPASKQTVQGLTLIECLVAIFVIGLTVSLITPPIFIAVASRAQSRRAEQALQIAQGEVDRIRVMVARSQHSITVLPKTVAGNLRLVAPPGGLVAGIKSPQDCKPRYDDTPLDVNRAVQIDVDGDCDPDFFMQVFRTAGTISADEIADAKTNPGSEKPTEFQLGVRVYSILAKSSLGSLQNPPEPASLGLTNGEGGQRSRPLAVLYTPFSWSDHKGTLCAYHQGADPNAPNPICP